MLPLWLGGTIAFVYGTVVGSFLNVCIYRLPAEQSIVSPPSHCPKCNNKLRTADLVPLLSFLFLGRKCRYCGAPISWRYFCVELVTGLLFVAVYLNQGAFTIDFFVYVVFVSALVVAFLVDMDRLIIPDQAVMACVAAGIAGDVAHLVAGDAQFPQVTLSAGAELPMLPSVIGMVVCAGVFYLIAYIGYFAFRPRSNGEEPASEQEQPEPAATGLHLAGAWLLAVLFAVAAVFAAWVLGPAAGAVLLIGLVVYVAYFVLSPEPVAEGVEDGEAQEYEGAVGGGDINLAAGIGAVLGVGGALVSFFVAIMLGAAVGVAYLIFKAIAQKRGLRWRTMLPFGPHMVTGAVLVILADTHLQAIWNAWSKWIAP